MGATSLPDPTTTPLEPGVLRLVLQPASLSRHIPTWSRLLLTLRFILNFLQSPTWKVGSETQRVVYYTGYPAGVVQAWLHLPLWRSTLHLVIDPSLLSLTTLPLVPHWSTF